MKKIFLYSLCALLLAESAALASDLRFSSRPNRANLIQWRAWSPETLAEARKQDRLIVLSLAAVWCHWCHVMDETTWSDDGIIELLNGKFIPIRVDADLRPDIDALYNQGGWPSTVILTPRGEVIDGGNYIPAGEMKGRLDRALTLYTRDRDKIELRTEEIRQRRKLLQQEMTGRPDRSDLDDIAELLKDQYDEKNGGFGSGQKFPNPDAIEILLALHARNRDPELKKMATRTLDRMAQSGLYDRVEGGFFRYATRSDWSEPHYEKMLEVNAGLIRAYANASLAFGTDRYHQVVRESIRYVQQNLSDEKSGAFFGSQDADEQYYHKEDRNGLARPAIDRTVYADSASLMISALVASAAALGDQQYLRTASRSAGFIMQELSRPAEGVFHAYRDGKASLPGQLNDNALFGLALLDLYDATGERRYLDRAGMVAQVLTGKFYEAKDRRFRPSLGSPGVAPVTPGILYEMNDNLANCRAALFLARFTAHSRDKAAKQIVDEVLATLKQASMRYAHQAPSYGLALLWSVGDLLEVIVLADGSRVPDYLAAVNSVYVPEKVVRVLSLREDREEIKGYGYKARESVYFCAGKRCSRPVSKVGRVRGELKDFLAHAGGT